MLNQEDMTETAKAVFNELSDKTSNGWEIKTEYPLSHEHLPAHTHAAGDGGDYLITSSDVINASSNGAFCCGNGRLVGVSAPGQPSAHAFRSQSQPRPTALAQKQREPIRVTLTDS